MRAFIQNTYPLLFKRSLITLVIALILPILFIFTSSGWILLLSLVYFCAGVVIHFNAKRWNGLIISILSVMLMLVFTYFWGLSLSLYKEPSIFLNMFASEYEKEEKIEAITGIDIPPFTIESSKLVHSQSFDSESTTHAVLKFKSLPNKQLFQYLDSVCDLEVPDSVDASSKIFAPGIESYYPCWSKKNNKYEFSIIGDLLKLRLHKEDAFFTLTLEKNSPYAKLRYGNF